LYALNTFEESGLGLTGNAFYGFDTVELGLGGLPMLQAQLVAGLATNDFWLGSLGLSPVPFNFTTLNDPVPSMLGSLRNRSLIPSSSWGYTAGAFYRDPLVYGSLTLGGYDASRFDSSKALTDIGFGADFSRDLVVELQSITHSTLGSSPLLAGSFFMFIDSMVSHMWLPVAICQAFENAFNITWNSTLELYIIDDVVRATLLAENPTFTFTLGASGERNDTVQITFPYTAFDLQVSQPIVENGTSRYFPLKQAHNSSQYTLGRVFLQEAYIIADYDRQNFTLAQALFPPSAQNQDLMAILPPDLEEKKTGFSLTTGTIVGIVVAAVVVVIVLVVGFLWKRRSHRNKNQGRLDALDAPQAASQLQEKHHFSSFRDVKQDPELDGGDTQRYEIDGNKVQPPELDGKKLRPAELDGWTHDRHGEPNFRHEIEGREIAHELEAPMSN
jgi:hypothetical protein